MKMKDSMQRKDFLLPGYRITEYRLVLNPHEELRNRIAELRSRFNEEFRIENAIRSRPDLCLVQFSQYEIMEERIRCCLKSIAMGYPPFRVELKDFGGFPDHTVFIQVKSKIPIQELVKKIRTDAGKLMKLNKDNKPYFMLEPTLTIARKLLPWQYEKGWLQLSHRQFTGRFIADALLLLKRRQGEMGWEIAERLELQNLPVNTRQGVLF